MMQAQVHGGHSCRLWYAGMKGLGKRQQDRKKKKKETKKEEQGKIEEFVDRCPGMKVEDKEKGWSAG